MSDKNASSASGGGLGLAGILTVIFVVLKVLSVAPVAGWSWVWVLSPLWISFGLFIALMVLFLLVGGLYAAFKS